MSIESFHCLVIPHYDGSTIEAYKLFPADSYRLRLSLKGGQWKWRFGSEKDNINYLSRESALMGCIGYLFRRTLQLSVELQKNEIDRNNFSTEPLLAQSKFLPRKFKCVDSIELGATSLCFIDILMSDGFYYVFYGDSTFSGPYSSKEHCLKDIVQNIAFRLDDFVKSIFRINTIIHCLGL